jgi:NAD(P)-dependent dehydrogenase (short-subunit alcohol dehydrogenase family)
MAEPAVAIITGAGGGIGRAIAIDLSRRGYSLALVGRGEANLNETAKLVVNGRVISADITLADDVQRIVATTLKTFGRIDALINNAGYAPNKRIDAITDKEWQDIVATNLSAPFHLMKAVWPAFKKQNGGVIVNISSEAARDPFPGLFAYGAAKAGLNIMGKALAVEGEAIGVRVHTVAPAAVETAMFRTILTPEQYPTEKTLDPADVARVVGLCVSGELRHNSGEVIYLRKTFRH